MSLSAILETEARAEIEAIRAESEQKAQALVQEARDRATALLNSRKTALDAQLQAGIVRARSAADLESAALRLGNADNALQQSFVQAKDQLLALTQSAQYREVLGKLLKEAQTALGTTATAVEVAPSDVEAAKAVVTSLGLNAEVRANPDVQTGIRLVAGRSAITNTLLGRLDRVRDTLASQVARLLNE